MWENTTRKTQNTDAFYAMNASKTDSDPYYWVNVVIPFINHEIREIFPNLTSISVTIHRLVPSLLCSDTSNINVKNLIYKSGENLPYPVCLEQVIFRCIRASNHNSENFNIM